MRLVADVGGTNTRIGLAEKSGLLAATVAGYRNDDYPDFLSLAEAFLSEAGAVRVSEAAVAVAGPVSRGRARLTNRDWQFDEARLSARFGGTPVRLLNDLKALGQAVPLLDRTSLDTVFAADPPPGEPTQALIIGIGTGFNVSPVIRAAGRVTCPDAEFGHVHLPRDIAEPLTARFGASAAQFETVEQVFSGRGFAAVSELCLGRRILDMREIGPDTDPRERDLLAFYARLLAALTRNLLLAFLPTAGIFFAGGVARALLATPARAEFVARFRAPFSLDPRLTAPVHLILDDAAALKGCAAYPVGG